MGAFGIVLGAMAAHALKDLLPTQLLNSFETAVRYQMVMAFFFLIAAMLPIRVKFQKPLFWLGLMGGLFFSGSIYALSLQAIIGIDVSFLGPVTPLGGLAMILAWSLLAVAVTQ